MTQSHGQEFGNEDHKELIASTGGGGLHAGAVRDGQRCYSTAGKETGEIDETKGYEWSREATYM